MDPEAAHDLTMDMLAKGQRTPLQWAWCQTRVDDPVELAGLRFPNRVGMAAGLDKNARCIDALGAMGLALWRWAPSPPSPSQATQTAHVQTARGPRTDQPPGVQQ